MVLAHADCRTHSRWIHAPRGVPTSGLLLALSLLGAACGEDPSELISTAPVVEILAPAPGALLGESPIEVRVRIRGEHRIASASVQAGDATLPIDPAALDASGEATLSVPLEDGAHALRVTAQDAERQGASANVEVVVDLVAPVLELGAPRAGTAETRRLLFAEVFDAGGIAAVSYAVNGGPAHAVAISGAPTSLVVREALPLIAGENRVALTLTDRVGHTRTEEIDLRYGLTTTAGGAHSGAIEDGALLTWGRYNVGQLGLGGALGDAQSRLAPERVPAFGAPGTEVAAIAFNQNTSLAVRSDGTVWTWGANGDGQLGHGDAVQRSVPAQVTAVSDIVYGVLGYSHALALRADGAVFAWGNNLAGQVGDDGAGAPGADQLAPIEVLGIPAPVVKLAAGSEHSLALVADGRVFVWGSNEYGTLGIGAADAERHVAPVAVPGIDDAIDLATGRDHVIVLRADGSVVAWGLGATGQLGYGVNDDPDGEDRASPVAVVADAQGTPLAGVRAVFANGNSSYAVVDAGGGPGALQYVGWGQNFSGQLAIGETSRQEWFARRAVMYTSGEAPVFLDEVVQFDSLGTGATHTIARTSTGGLFSWGWNFRGSLGVPAIVNAWAQTVAVEIELPAPSAPSAP